MFFDGYNVHSSLVASRARHDDMLEFAAHNHVKPAIEEFELSEKGMEEALKKLSAGHMRYRGVLAAN
jgi:D-arabinose 1-dehydrogenase-like Zn-dependent alcohol dehydrogenase